MLFYVLIFIGVTETDCLAERSPIASALPSSTTIPPVWPTVEGGKLLLRPGPCNESLRNCSFHGVCARHGFRPVCLCSQGFHGNYCEVVTRPLPVIYVVFILILVFSAYAIVHLWCVCRRIQRERRPLRNGQRKLSTVCEYGSLRKLSEPCARLNGNRKTNEEGLAGEPNASPSLHSTGYCTGPYSVNIVIAY